MDYLTGASKDHYDKCIGQLRRQIGDGIPVKNNGCQFIPKTSHQSVALVSFPGSGNTWVRQLLEAASGICTGSTMCDMSLRFAGFTGENIQSSAVLAVKTHVCEPNWNGTPGNLDSDYSFSSAIILVRNPMDAMVSEWKRRAANDFNVRTLHLDTHKRQTQISNFSKLCFIPRVHYYYESMLLFFVCLYTQEKRRLGLDLSVTKARNGVI